MASLQDLINLAKADGGKFFVIDEQGEPKLVIMGIDEYQKMLLGKLQRQILDVEKINKMITQAQLNEEAIQNFKSSPRTDQRSWFGTGAQLTEEISAAKPSISPTVQTVPQPRARVDLREEVIDPSFDFEGPKVEVDDL